MKKHFFPFFSYIQYWLLQEDQYSIQSPFVFEIYNGLIGYLQENQGHFLDIESLRENLLKDTEVLEIKDFGAGSKRVPGQFRETHKIARYSSSFRKFSLLYQYFCHRTAAKNVLELGTCLGINTRYLSQATKGNLYTLEGSESLWRKAQEINPPSNVKYVLGQIADTLPKLLDDIPAIDFALIDATHTYAATLAYFEMVLDKIQPNGILAVADIHWSREMDQAWEKIKSNPRVQVSIDFYECGILIFDPKLTKSHYILKY